MPSASPSLNSFNAGEFSPLMMGQTNFDKWSSGVKSMVNFIPRSQGPAERRGGTYFVGEVKSSENKVWLAKFEFNTVQAFILEFGPGYIRFYSDHGVALDSSGNVLEVSTAFTANDLTNSDGGFGLSMVQSGDVIYICSHTGSRPPYKLSRLSNADWTMAEFDIINALGPFADINTNRNLTVFTNEFRIWSSSGAERPDGTPTTTNLCTITANSSIFQESHVGSLFYIESSTDKTYGLPIGNNSPDTTWGSIGSWQAGKDYYIGQFVRSDGKYYEAIMAAGSSTPGSKDQSGATQPTWTSGAHNDGQTGITWRYSNGGWGVIQITSVTSGSVAVGKILQELPPSVRTDTAKTYKYAFGDWSAGSGYPTKVSFYKNRLCFAGRGKLWMSVSSDFENFTPMTNGYEVQSDDAINVQIESDSTNTIQWLATGSSLLVGTAGAEHSCSPSTTTTSFGPANIQITKESSYGSKGVNAVQVGTTSMFVQRAGCKVRAVLADYESGSYSSSDLTVLAEHITRVGIVDMAWQQEPDYVLWVVLADGSLVALTYNDEQKVTAWHRHDLSGQVESVACIPDPSGVRDDVWFVVKRTVNGVTKRYVEYLHSTWDAGYEAFPLAYYVDCGLTYNGPPVASVSGLAHLEGKSVAITTDGAAHDNRVVTGGSVSLDCDSSVVHVGLPFTSELITLPLESGGTSGTSQGKTKRISKLTLRFVNTLGGKAGLDGGLDMDILESRDYSDLMDSPPAPFTDDRDIDFPGGYDTKACIRVIQDQPLPMTLVAIYPRSWTSGE